MRKYFMTTKRLGFSTWQEGDRDLAVTLWGSKDVTKYICASGVFTAQQIEDRLKKEMENQKQLNMQYWPLFIKNGNQFIGCCGLRPSAAKKNVFELGFHLTKDNWGKGYAMEAADKVITHAFIYLNAAELFAGHHPANEKSRKILTKLGFIYHGDVFYEPTGLFHPSYFLKNV